MAGDAVAVLMSGIGVRREKAAELLSAADGDVELATEMFFAPGTPAQN
eukprot:gene22312-33184_t